MAKRKRSHLEMVPSNTPSKEDSRVFCRFVLKDIPVRFKDLKIGNKGNGVCKDISAGGVGIECAHELKPRTPLEMWFDFPDGFEPMHFLGKVIWTSLFDARWRVGIEFQRQKLMSLARIMKLEVSKNNNKK